MSTEVRNFIQHSATCPLEAHIQYPVCLVEHKQLDVVARKTVGNTLSPDEHVRQRDTHAFLLWSVLEVVQEASRCPNKEIHAVNNLLLLLETFPANRQSRREVVELSNKSKDVENLKRQFCQLSVCLTQQWNPNL